MNPDGRRRRRWSSPPVANPREVGSAIIGGIGNSWRWLIGKPEHLIALSTVAIFATAMVIGVGIAQRLKSLDLATRQAADAATDANRLARESLESSRRARISIINLTTRISPEGMLTIDADLKNSGDFAATKTFLDVWFSISREFVPPSEQLFNLRLTSDSEAKVVGSFETIHFRTEKADVIGAPQIERAKLGQLHIQAGLAIRYLDGFDKARTTWNTTWFDRAQGLFIYRGGGQN